MSATNSHRPGRPGPLEQCERLRERAQVIELERLHAIMRARQQGATWDTIARAIGMSDGGLRKRYHMAADAPPAFVSCGRSLHHPGGGHVYAAVRQAGRRSLADLHWLLPHSQPRRGLPTWAWMDQDGKLHVATVTGEPPKRIELTPA
jgi:hypothetical protein